MFILILFQIISLISNEVEVLEIYDFGEVLTNTNVEHTFIFENKTKFPYNIFDISATNRLEILKSPLEIPSEGKEEIKVVLDTSNFYGKIERAVNLEYFSEEEGKTKKARFIIKGFVHMPVEINILEKESKKMAYYPEPVFYKFKATCFKKDVSNFEIKELKFVSKDNIEFKTFINKTNDPYSYEIKIEPAQILSTGFYEFEVYVYTNVMEASPLKANLNFDIKSPFIISQNEVIFHSALVFNKIKISKECPVYLDKEMKNKSTDLLINGNFFLINEENKKAYISNFERKYWINSDCVEKLNPSIFDKTRTIYLNEYFKKPFNILSFSLENPNLSFFLREENPYTKAFVITLTKKVEKDETAYLKIKTDYKGFEEISIPIKIYKE